MLPTMFGIRLLLAADTSMVGISLIYCGHQISKELKLAINLNLITSIIISVAGIGIGLINHYVNMRIDEYGFYFFFPPSLLLLEHGICLGSYIPL